eukprot:g1769.t1
MNSDSGTPLVDSGPANSGMNSNPGPSTDSGSVNSGMDSNPGPPTDSGPVNSEAANPAGGEVSANPETISPPTDSGPVNSGMNSNPGPSTDSGSINSGLNSNSGPPTDSGPVNSGMNSNPGPSTDSGSVNSGMDSNPGPPTDSGPVNSEAANPAGGEVSANPETISPPTDSGPVNSGMNSNPGPPTDSGPVNSGMNSGPPTDSGPVNSGAANPAGGEVSANPETISPPTDSGPVNSGMNSGPPTDSSPVNSGMNSNPGPPTDSGPVNSEAANPAGGEVSANPETISPPTDSGPVNSGMNSNPGPPTDPNGPPSNSGMNSNSGPPSDPNGPPNSEAANPAGGEVSSSPESSTSSTPAENGGSGGDVDSASGGGEEELVGDGAEGGDGGGGGEEAFPVLQVVVLIILILLLMRALYGLFVLAVRSLEKQKMAKTYERSERVFEEVSVNFDYQLCKMLGVFVENGGTMGDFILSLVWEEIEPADTRESLCNAVGCKFAADADDATGGECKCASNAFETSLTAEKAKLEYFHKCGHLLTPLTARGREYVVDFAMSHRNPWADDIAQSATPLPVPDATGSSAKASKKKEKKKKSRFVPDTILCDVESQQQGSCDAKHASCVDTSAEEALARANFRMIPFDFHKKLESDGTKRYGCESACVDSKKTYAQGTFLWTRVAHDDGKNAVTDVRIGSCGIKMNYLHKYVKENGKRIMKKHPFAQCATNSMYIHAAAKAKGTDGKLKLSKGMHYMTMSTDALNTLNDATTPVGSCAVCDPLMNAQIREYFESDPLNNPWLGKFHGDHTHKRNQLQFEAATALCALNTEENFNCEARQYQFVPQIASVTGTENDGAAGRSFCNFDLLGMKERDYEAPFDSAQSMWLQRPWEMPADMYGGMDRSSAGVQNLKDYAKKFCVGDFTACHGEMTPTNLVAFSRNDAFGAPISDVAVATLYKIGWDATQKTTAGEKWDHDDRGYSYYVNLKQMLKKAKKLGATRLDSNAANARKYTQSGLSVDELRNRGYIKVGSPGTATTNCKLCVLWGYSFDRSTNSEDLYRGEIYVRRDPSILFKSPPTKLRSEAASFGREGNALYGEACEQDNDCVSTKCREGVFLRTCGCKNAWDCPMWYEGETKKTMTCTVDTNLCTAADPEPTTNPASSKFHVKWYRSHVAVRCKERCEESTSEEECGDVPFCSWKEANGGGACVSCEEREASDMVNPRGCVCSGGSCKLPTYCARGVPPAGGSDGDVLTQDLVDVTNSKTCDPTRYKKCYSTNMLQRPDYDRDKNWETDRYDLATLWEGMGTACGGLNLCGAGVGKTLSNAPASSTTPTSTTSNPSSASSDPSLVSSDLETANDPSQSNDKFVQCQVCLEASGVYMMRRSSSQAITTKKLVDCTQVRGMKSKLSHSKRLVCEQLLSTNVTEETMDRLLASSVISWGDIEEVAETISTPDLLSDEVPVCTMFKACGANGLNLCTTDMLPECDRASNVPTILVDGIPIGSPAADDDSARSASTRSLDAHRNMEELLSKNLVGRWENLIPVFSATDEVTLGDGTPLPDLQLPEARYDDLYFSGSCLPQTFSDNKIDGRSTSPFINAMRGGLGRTATDATPGELNAMQMRIPKERHDDVVRAVYKETDNVTTSSDDENVLKDAPLQLICHLKYVVPSSKIELVYRFKVKDFMPEYKIAENFRDNVVRPRGSTKYELVGFNVNIPKSIYALSESLHCEHLSVLVSLSSQLWLKQRKFNQLARYHHVLKNQKRSSFEIKEKHKQSKRLVVMLRTWEQNMHDLEKYLRAIEGETIRMKDAYLASREEWMKKNLLLVDGIDESVDLRYIDGRSGEEGLCGGLCKGLWKESVPFSRDCFEDYTTVVDTCDASAVRDPATKLRAMSELSPTQVEDAQLMREDYLETMKATLREIANVPSESTALCPKNVPLIEVDGISYCSFDDEESCNRCCTASCEDVSPPATVSSQCKSDDVDSICLGHKEALGDILLEIRADLKVGTGGGLSECPKYTTATDTGKTCKFDKHVLLVEDASAVPQVAYPGSKLCEMCCEVMCDPVLGASSVGVVQCPLDKMSIGNDGALDLNTVADDAVKTGDLATDEVFMILPSKYPFAIEEPECPRAFFSAWKAIDDAYCGNDEPVDPAVVVATCADPAVCEYAKRCVVRWTESIANVETPADNDIVSRDEVQKWDDHLRGDERVNQLHLYWLDALDGGDFALTDFTSQQRLVMMTLLTKRGRRLDVATDRLESEIMELEAKGDRGKSEALDSNLHDLSRDVNDATTILDDLMRKIELQLTRRNEAKKSVFEILNKQLRCNLHEELYFAKSKPGWDFCAWCNKFCDGVEGQTLDDLRQAERGRIHELRNLNGATASEAGLDYPLPPPRPRPPPPDALPHLVVANVDADTLASSALKKTAGSVVDKISDGQLIRFDAIPMLSTAMSRETTKWPIEDLSGKWIVDDESSDAIFRYCRKDPSTDVLLSQYVYLCEGRSGDAAAVSTIECLRPVDAIRKVPSCKPVCGKPENGFLFDYDKATLGTPACEVFAKRE